jgi:hypothetical protein
MKPTMPKGSPKMPMAPMSKRKPTMSSAPAPKMTPQMAEKIRSKVGKMGGSKW